MSWNETHEHIMRLDWLHHVILEVHLDVIYVSVSL